MRWEMGDGVKECIQANGRDRLRDCWDDRVCEMVYVR